MATYTADQFNVRVVEPGDAVIRDNAYFGHAEATLAKGDLIRINDSGQVETADAASAGACHGMVLQDWTTAPTTSQYVKILQFADNTILEGQVYDATGDAAVTIGSSYTLRNGSAGIWSITTTTTNGVALVVDKVSNDKWSEETAGDAYGLVRFRFSQTTLDTYAAAS